LIERKKAKRKKTKKSTCFLKKKNDRQFSFGKIHGSGHKKIFEKE